MAGAAQAEKEYAANGGEDGPKGKGKGKDKFGKGKGKGKFGKKGVYGVDEGDEAQQQSSAEWAEEGLAEEEHAGAVYDKDDEMINECCGCMYCPEPLLSEPDNPFMCPLSEENLDEVCAITFEEGFDEGVDVKDECIATKI